MTKDSKSSAEETMKKIGLHIENYPYKKPAFAEMCYDLRNILKLCEQIHKEIEAMKKNSKLDNRLKYFKDCCIMWEALGTQMMMNTFHYPNDKENTKEYWQDLHIKRVEAARHARSQVSDYSKKQ